MYYYYQIGPHCSHFKRDVCNVLHVEVSILFGNSGDNHVRVTDGFHLKKADKKMI